ncbi:MAG: hypothetical protein LBJ58_06430 [Tannerellaceae bacterium]|jgi:hypothetical protein|nr:hypothetical protein [Tannerellaceae bacterium]
MRVVFCFLLATGFVITTSSALHAQQANGQSDAVRKEATTTPAIEVIAVDNRIKVSNAPVGSRLEIYSVVGIKVADIEMKQSCGEYVVNIAKGYYIIRIGETVRKVAIR